ncbi:MAG: zf-HC2 domain-containing protein [Gemmatimonadaceae bacterium]
MTLPPIDCRHAMAELWDYLDDELPAERTQQIREHLATCTGCQSHVQFCRAFLVQIQMTRVSQTEVSSLRDRVQAALQRDGLSIHDKN